MMHRACGFGVKFYYLFITIVSSLFSSGRDQTVLEIKFLFSLTFPSACFAVINLVHMYFNLSSLYRSKFLS